MTDVTIRWAGPADADDNSTYKIERTLNNVNWTELDAAQAATSPYTSVFSTLDGNHAYGVDTISVADGTDFSSDGFGWLDDALVQWTGKTSNDLTGVTWHSGYGTYASGTTLYEAHESYDDTGLTIALHAALYRITHTNAAGDSSPPRYLWYYHAPTPESADHCVVIVNVNTDLGIEARAGIRIYSYLAADTDFARVSGSHLDAGKSSKRDQTTNAFGLATFHCWKTSARQDGLAYVFELDATDTAKRVETVTTIPDRDWVLLSDLI